jgi:hypothetical protein
MTVNNGNNGLRRMWKKVVVAYYPRICLVGSKENHEKLPSG